MAYEPVEVPLTVDMPPLLAKLHTENLLKQGFQVHSSNVAESYRLKYRPLSLVVPFILVYYAICVL